MAIEQLFNKALKQADFKTPHRVNDSGYGGGSYVKSNATYHKCYKNDHVHKYCRDKGTVSSGNPPKKPQMSFQNGSQRSLLFQKTNILKDPPRPTITRITSGSPIAIMVMVHGDLTGRMDTMSGKISKAINHLFDSPIPSPTK